MFGLKPKTEPRAPQNLQRLEAFIAEYAASPEKDIYAMHLWGEDQAFTKVFGTLEGFHSSDTAKQSKYKTMLGINAVNDVREGNLASAACSNFFMNYLVATNGCGRRQLTGSLKQIAESIDDIVRHGALKMGF